MEWSDEGQELLYLFELSWLPSPSSTTIASSHIPRKMRKQIRVSDEPLTAAFLAIGDRRSEHRSKKLCSGPYNRRRASWLQTVQLFSLNNFEQLAPPPRCSCCPHGLSIRPPLRRPCQHKVHQRGQAHSRRHTNPVRRLSSPSLD